MARSLVLVAIAAALLVAAWLELERDREPLLELLAVLGLALAPAALYLLLRRVWVALAALPLAAAAAASLAFDVPLTDMRPGSGHDFFGPAFGAIADGFRDMYDTDTPFDRLEHPELAGLTLLAIFGLVAVCALLIAVGRPLAAGIVLLVGVGFPATISATVEGSSPLRTGALVLGALLVLLFATRSGERPLRGALAALAMGGLVVLVSVAASTSGAVAKDAFVAWESWDFYDKPADPVGVRYVWSSNYTGITFPEKPTVVLTIKAENEARYWRATTLDEFTGVGWRERLELVARAAPGRRLETSADPLLPRAARNRANWTKQEVTVEALADNHLVAAAYPVRWEGLDSGPVLTSSGGIVLQPSGLVQGQEYTVWSYAPQVEPKQLAGLPARYPDELSAFLEVVPDVRFPAFGTRNRDRAVEELFADREDDALLAAYEPLYEQALEVVGDVKTPYLAAASLEAWFRGAGGFRYEEQPEQPLDATPPLVDFVLRTKEGYCQQFAGAMALMLRLLGIPARVAAGFTSGEYDDRRDEWTITDYNAHTWVEVYFPGYGWLSFDPTPGRGELAAPYSTASPVFGEGGFEALGVAPNVLSAILRERLAGIERPAGGTPDAAVGTATSDGGGVGIVGIVFLGIAAAIVLLVAVKELRRRLRFVSRDPRKVATACRRDLVGFLADQGVSFSESSTLEDLGSFVESTYRVNTRPFVLTAGAARFGSPALAERSGRDARREVRSLERQLRRELTLSARARGALNLRSLTV